MIYECERRLQIEVPAETVWDWMSDLRRLLSLNSFHVHVDSAEPVNEVGQRVPIRHNVFGLYRRVRIARIRVYRPFHVAWGGTAGRRQGLVPAQPVLHGHTR